TRTQRRLQVAYDGVAAHPQYVAFAPLPQCLTKLCMATQLIVTRHPAVRHLLPPRVEHLQALLVPRVIPHLRRDMALLTPLLIPYPGLGQRQAEVEQGMVVARDVPHEDANLQFIDFASVAAPLA